jgi:type VI secretion system protein VasD
LVTLALLVGCSSDTKKWRVVLMPTSTLNQDDAGASLPVLVRVYQLRGKEKFQQATFKALWKSDKEALEGDLVERKEITVHPSTEAEIDVDLEVKHGAAFLGVMAVFRQPNAEGWKQVVPAKSSAMNPFTPKVRLELNNNTIKVED